MLPGGKICSKNREIIVLVLLTTQPIETVSVWDPHEPLQFFCGWGWVRFAPFFFFEFSVQPAEAESTSALHNISRIVRGVQPKKGSNSALRRRIQMR